MVRVAQRYAKSTSAPTAAPPSAPVILMVSGGADSCALLVLAATDTLDIAENTGDVAIARERLHVLHINHMARGLSAQEDEEFVIELAKRYGIPTTVRHIDVVNEAKASGLGFEGYAREVRYQAAQELVTRLSREFGTKERDARILTGHTIDDRAETFVMNALRGSGAAGLSGLKARRGKIVRPLLSKTHAELCEYLRMRNIVWCEDDTNTDTSYLRNYIRHEVLAPVAQRLPAAVKNIATSAAILGDEDSFLKGLAKQRLAELITFQAEGIVVLSASRLVREDIALARRMVREALLSLLPSARLESKHIEAVLRLAAKGAGSIEIVEGCSVSVAYNALVLKTQDAKARVGNLAVPGFFDTLQGRLKACVRKAEKGTNPCLLAQQIGAVSRDVALLDAKKVGVSAGGDVWVDHPLLGDTLQPLGLEGHTKSLSSLLSERRIPPEQRFTVPVVRRAAGREILWVAGVQLDRRWAVDASTTHILLLRLHR